jgi:hypothetical protein
MKKIHSALVSMVLVLGLSTGAQAATFYIDGDLNTLPIDAISVPKYLRHRQ